MVIIITMPGKQLRRLKRLMSVMEGTAPGYQHAYSVGRHENNSGDYNLYVHSVPSVLKEEEDRLRNFVKGIIVGWECPE